MFALTDLEPIGRAVTAESYARHVKESPGQGHLFGDEFNAVHPREADGTFAEKGESDKTGKGDAEPGFSLERATAAKPAPKPAPDLKHGDRVSVPGLTGYTEIWGEVQPPDDLGIRSVQVMNPETRHKLWTNAAKVGKVGFELESEPAAHAPPVGSRKRVGSIGESTLRREVTQEGVSYQLWENDDGEHYLHVLDLDSGQMVMGKKYPAALAKEAKREYDKTALAAVSSGNPDEYHGVEGGLLEPAGDWKELEKRAQLAQDHADYETAAKLWKQTENAHPGRDADIDTREGKEAFRFSERARRARQIAERQPIPPADKRKAPREVDTKPPSDAAAFKTITETMHAEQQRETPGASSRLSPVADHGTPLGTWRIDDKYRGIHGRQIEQLREIDPNTLIFSEDMAMTNDEGRADDAERYKEWRKQGKRPPPISVVETDNGDHRIVDGHRRARAAQLAGEPVEAWVSPIGEAGTHSGSGQTIKTGLTWEIAKRDRGEWDKPDQWHDPEKPPIELKPPKKADPEPTQIPHEMTIAEYKTRRGDNPAALAFHRREVRKAIEDGKPVPEAVLADYPDLKPKAGGDSKAPEPEPPAAYRDYVEMATAAKLTPRPFDQWERDRQATLAKQKETQAAQASDPARKRYDDYAAAMRAAKIEPRPFADWKAGLKPEKITEQVKDSPPEPEKTDNAKGKEKPAPAPKPPAHAKTASKLREMADSMAEAADSDLGRDRKTNTRKRSEQARHSIEDAYKRQAVANTLRNLADHLEGGNAQHIAGVKNRAQVEALDLALRRGKNEAQRGLSYREMQQTDGLPYTEEHVKAAKFPEMGVHATHIRDVLKDVKGKPGTAKAAEYFSRLGYSDTYWKSTGQAAEDALDALITAGEKYGADRYALKMLKEGRADYNRLRSAGITPDNFHAALEEYRQLKSYGEREPAWKAKERALIGQKLPGFFPTPKRVIGKMLDRADIQPGMTVLEPSAGKGDILEEIKRAHPEAKRHAIEISSGLRDLLQAKGHELHDDRDFLEHHGEYDRIVQNPPFENHQDIEHVRHAYSLLKPGGRLVSVMSVGPFQRSQRKDEEFRDWFESAGGEMEPLEAGSFAGADAFRQTGVSTVLVTLDKPK